MAFDTLYSVYIVIRISGFDALCCHERAAGGRCGCGLDGRGGRQPRGRQERGRRRVRHLRARHAHAPRHARGVQALLVLEARQRGGLLRDRGLRRAAPRADEPADAPPASEQPTDHVLSTWKAGENSVSESVVLKKLVRTGFHAR